MRITPEQKIMLTVMVVALELVLIYASGMFGYVGYPLVVLASVSAYTLTCEGLYGMAFLSFAASCVIGYLIAPDKIPVIAFAALFGHYPMIKTYVDDQIKTKISALCVKLLYCNAFLIGGLCTVIFALKMSLPTSLPIPMWLVVAGAEGAFIVIDLIHSFCKWLYTEKLRTGILPKR